MQPLLAERARKRTVAGPSLEGSPLAEHVEMSKTPVQDGLQGALAISAKRHTAPHCSLGRAWGCGLEEPCPGLDGTQDLPAGQALQQRPTIQYSPGLQDWGPGGPWPSLETTLVSVVACRWRKTASFYWKSRFLICADVVGVFSAT